MLKRSSCIDARWLCKPTAEVSTLCPRSKPANLEIREAEDNDNVIRSSAPDVESSLAAQSDATLVDCTVDSLVSKWRCRKKVSLAVLWLNGQ